MPQPITQARLNEIEVYIVTNSNANEFEAYVRRMREQGLIID